MTTKELKDLAVIEIIERYNKDLQEFAEWVGKKYYWEYNGWVEIGVYNPQVSKGVKIYKLREMWEVETGRRDK